MRRTLALLGPGPALAPPPAPARASPPTARAHFHHAPRWPGTTTTTGASSTTSHRRPRPRRHAPRPPRPPRPPPRPPPVPIGDLDLALIEVAGGFTAAALRHRPSGRRPAVRGGAGRAHPGAARPASASGPSSTSPRSVSTGGERGLLGLAFHPAYPADPRFYVDYTDRQREHRGGRVPGVGRPRPGRPGFRAASCSPWTSPTANHNGGHGRLRARRLPLHRHGRRRGRRRPRPHRPGPGLPARARSCASRWTGDPYAVPPNPWAGDGGAARGVGQGPAQPLALLLRRRPDLHRRRRPGRLGGDRHRPPRLRGGSTSAGRSWRAPTATARPGCDPTGLQPPVLEYGHDGGACSVTGGYVYRGAALPELAGSYFYGDYCSGRISSFRHDPEGLYDLRDWTDTLGAVSQPHFVRGRRVRRVVLGLGDRGRLPPGAGLSRSAASAAFQEGSGASRAGPAAAPGPPVTGPDAAPAAATLP